MSDLNQGPADLDVGELRRRLTLARTEEEDLSYARRILHGRMDILKAELDARRGGRGTLRSLDSLREALTERAENRAVRGGRARIDARVSEHERAREAERVAAEVHLARLPDLGAEEIELALERIADEETRVSAERRELHRAIDALEAELATRYKEGLAPPV